MNNISIISEFKKRLSNEECEYYFKHPNGDNPYRSFHEESISNGTILSDGSTIIEYVFDVNNKEELATKLDSFVDKIRTSRKIEDKHAKTELEWRWLIKPELLIINDGSRGIIKSIRASND